MGVCEFSQWKGILYLPLISSKHLNRLATPPPKRFNTTYSNGVVIPTLQKSMVCTVSNAGLSKSNRMEDNGGVRDRGWGHVWSFW
ncbi:uncharacterized protein EAF01_000399 [Botrytis porri]|uniref:uncharacterized protein n=1 Tax=Botrytis porri TaxID=87229 RepID=UPI0019027A83|nr:uncharacterized protein EAF01_000399 [Botrytis porri]KAF7913993.1 hypothetical protein EAF01_000399 [Botrytis porri]